MGKLTVIFYLMFHFISEVLQELSCMCGSLRDAGINLNLTTLYSGLDLKLLQHKCKTKKRDFFFCSFSN